ncbi:hypothetical protein [Caecibacteroides pullorum]|uniref:Uncharacterized protein n=1 Tax=Caecibacteroides pullorum TaxID=2725562 RepID=A0AA40ZRT9_9BACT|nr:hypothetical protein [Caecibacteroides pullorum]MBM6856374.1 hypothetical protein [Caecibacteroides pullorum]MBV8057381.1 hypothetical protein [Caecibacteroides pullorum]
MKKIILLISVILLGFIACTKHSNSEKGSKLDEKTQVDILHAGLFFVDDNSLSPEQKELKVKIEDIALHYIEVDTIAHHLQLTITEKEFKQKGMDESLYQECLANIAAINAYADSTGMGKQMMESWLNSKANHLESQRKEQN